MKNLLVLFLITFSGLTFSQELLDSVDQKELRPWVRVSAGPNGVNVTINNFTQYDYTCRGTIYITYESGRSSSEYLFAYVYSNFTHSKYIFNRNYEDRIRYASDRVFCNRTR